MEFSVVTTFNQSGYEKYASKMIDTFLVNWPKDFALHVYAEDCAVIQTAPNLHVHDFHAEVPALVAFKNKYRNDLRATGQLATGPADKKGKQPGIGFRWDAIRFSHKVYAVCDLAKKQNTDVVMWMDADMVCHSPMSRTFVEKMSPESAGIAFLGRKRKFTECGLYTLNLNHTATQKFVEMFQHAYDDAENGIFTMSEWNDCWVFDRCRERIQAQFPAWKQLDWSAHLNMAEGHPLVNTEWGAYLDHLKGGRKDIGRSKRTDLVSQRNETYWNTV